jgi:hypothetical protein
MQDAQRCLSYSRAVRSPHDAHLVFVVIDLRFNNHRQHARRRFSDQETQPLYVGG